MKWGPVRRDDKTSYDRSHQNYPVKTTAPYSTQPWSSITPSFWHPAISLPAAVVKYSDDIGDLIEFLEETVA